MEIVFTPMFASAEEQLHPFGLSPWDLPRKSKKPIEPPREETMTSTRISRQVERAKMRRFAKRIGVDWRSAKADTHLGRKTVTVTKD